MADKVRPLVVKSAPYTPPKMNEIVIRNGAVAINPVDCMIQTMGSGMAFPWIKFPFVLGVDTAGEVVEVGSKVTRFKVGDRVLGQGLGGDKQSRGAPESSFQDYVVLLADMSSPIPDDLSYEKACVLPLGFGTAACSLYQTDHLGLKLPSTKPEPTGKTILIWGGSTSVGSNAIQMAVASGYEVFATASPKNFAYVRSLGATKVFDYNSSTVVQDIVQAFQGKTTAGAMWLGEGIRHGVHGYHEPVPRQQNRLIGGVSDASRDAEEHGFPDDCVLLSLGTDRALAQIETVWNQIRVRVWNDACIQRSRQGGVPGFLARGIEGEQICGGSRSDRGWKRPREYSSWDRLPEQGSVGQESGGDFDVEE